MFSQSFYELKNQPMPPATKPPLGWTSREEDFVIYCVITGQPINFISKYCCYKENKQQIFSQENHLSYARGRYCNQRELEI
jgi:hypothetical protein